MKRVKNEIQYQTHHQLIAQVISKSSALVRAQVGAKVRNDTWDKIVTSILPLIKNQTKEETQDEINQKRG